MPQYLELIKLALANDSIACQETLHCVERLYFAYIRPRFKWLSQSEEAKLAADLLSIESALACGSSIALLKLHSNYFSAIKGDLCSAFRDGNYPAAAERIRREVLSTQRHIVTAVFIAYLVSIEERKARFRFALPIVVSVIATVLLAILKLVGDIHASR